MSMRFDALRRVWALLWGGTVGWALSLLALIVGTFVGSFDIFLQLVTGSEVFDDDAAASTWVRRTLSWNFDNHVYALTGGGQYEWWP